MSPTAFLARYPEFARAGLPLVEAVLGECAARLDVGTWGTLFDAGHGLLTAHTLALSPFGQAARMAPKDGVTTYWRQYDELLRIVSCGGAVAAGYVYRGWGFPGPGGLFP